MEDRAPQAVTTPPAQGRASPQPHALAMPQVGLAIVCLLHAVPLTAAAVVVPTVRASWFGISAFSLALVHLVVCVLALTRRERLLALAWHTLAIFSLLWLLTLSVIASSAALYLSVLYEGIGQAVSGALACVWGLVVLFTVPISVWGLAATRPAWLRGPPVAAATVVAVLAAVVATSSLRPSVRAEPVHNLSKDTESLLRGAVAAHGAQVASVVHTSLLHTSPAVCREPVDARRLTLLLTTLDKEGRPFAACLQTPDAGSLAAQLTLVLAERAQAKAPLALDLVHAVSPIPALHPLLDAFSLRPALDGICSRERCLAPWQLVALDAFTRYHPLEAVRDASFGVALPELTQALGAAEGSPLTRVETKSWLVHGDALVPLVRMRLEHVAPDDTSLARAVDLAGRHILAAQRPEGSFRYLLDPFSGRTDDRAVNLPRQAGTLFALCELLPSAETTQAATRGLAQLASFEKRAEAVSALSDDAALAELGRTALPLIAFVTCREHVGDRHDALIGRLAKYMLAMQRPDGSFFPHMELPKGTPAGRHEPLYAAGQAVLSLVLVEQLRRDDPRPQWPAKALLASAVSRAMSHYGRVYWPKPLRSLFYLEENWHCLAARAALRSHRDDAYEQFCLDYVRFKGRLILDAQQGTSPEHVGGYGLSDMFPPHSTATAGYGEALSAAIAVAHKRGLPLREQQTTLRSVLGFVVRQQWTTQNCFACAANAEAVGGFSESSASPSIRIDYVQHAMAALGHGRRALALQTTPRKKAHALGPFDRASLARALAQN